MPGQRLKCYCGNCPACLHLMNYRAAYAVTVGCRCGVRNCDCARWEATFERNHGDEMRDYYSSSTIRSAGSTLGDVVGLDLRGAGLGDHFATGPTNYRWKDVMRRQAQAAIEQRELRRAA
jgi:hypothetical protein